MRVKGLLLLCGTLAGCPRATGGPPTRSPVSGDSSGDSGTPSDVEPGIPEYAACAPQLGGCAGGRDCVPLLSSTNGFCLASCTWPAGVECREAQRCVPRPDDASGVCLSARDFWEPCGLLDACPSAAYCGAVVGTARCVPICDANGLAGFEAVASCAAVPPPASLSGEPATCVASSVGTASASLCVVDVRVGEACDEYGLRCNPGSSANVGELACVSLGGGRRCLRLCADATTGPVACGCSGSEPRCRDPADPGIAWSCEHWNELAVDLRGCVYFEACDSPSACADNTASGLLRCAASPYGAGDACLWP